MSGHERIYAALLVAYSRRFRERFANEACLVFGDCLRAAQREGSWAVCRLWARTLPDLVITAAADRFNEGGPMVRRLAFPAAVLALAPALVFWSNAAFHAFSVRLGLGNPYVGIAGLPHFGPLGPYREACIVAGWVILTGPGVALLLMMASAMRLNALVEGGRLRLAIETRWLGWTDVTLVLAACAAGACSLAWLIPHALVGT